MEGRGAPNFQVRFPTSRRVNDSAGRTYTQPVTHTFVLHRIAAMAAASEGFPSPSLSWWWWRFRFRKRSPERSSPTSGLAELVARVLPRVPASFVSPRTSSLLFSAVLLLLLLNMKTVLLAPHLHAPRESSLLLPLPSTLQESVATSVSPRRFPCEGTSSSCKKARLFRKDKLGHIVENATTHQGAAARQHGPAMPPSTAPTTTPPPSTATAKATNMGNNAHPTSTGAAQRSNSIEE